MRGIDEIDDANGWTGGVLCLMARCVTFLDEFNELDVAGLRKVALEAEEPVVIETLSQVKRPAAAHQLKQK